MSTLSILVLALLQSQAAPVPGKSPAKGEEPKTQTFFEYRDSARDLTLKMENGRVELVVPNENGKKSSDLTTYKADSLDDFKRRYPEVAKKYELDRLIPKSMTPKEAESLWKEWTKRFGGDEEEFVRKHMSDVFKNGPEGFKEVDRWFDEEHQRLRDLEHQLRSETESFQPQGPRFGVMVSPLGDALRAQLGLKSDEGVIVYAVEKGSLAEKAGLKQYDILLRLNGQAIEDPSRFKDQVVTPLQSKEFVLDIVRGGIPQKLTIHPVHS